MTDEQAGRALDARIAENADKWWHTYGYMIARDGSQCHIWLGNFRTDETAFVPYDSSMPDWLFDSTLDFFGDGVAFNVEIPWAYADAPPDAMEGISWRNWERQAYDDKSPEELFQWLSDSEAAHA